MNDSVIINSAKDGTRLTFSDVTDDAFTVTIEGVNFSGNVIVPSYHSGFPNPLFDEFAAEWRGWEGEKKWSSLEGELHLTATSDKLGHVFLSVTLGVDFGWRNEWKLKTKLVLEAGQLELLAKSMNKLFSAAKFQIDR